MWQCFYPQPRFQAKECNDCLKLVIHCDPTRCRVAGVASAPPALSFYLFFFFFSLLLFSTQHQSSFPIAVNYPMSLFASSVSIFDIHLILLSITLYLTPQQIELCQSVSKTWRSCFYPFRRIQAQWRSPLTLTDQERLLSQCANIWTLSIPLDDPTSHPLIQSGRLNNVRELTCLGRGTYKDLYGSQWLQTSPGSNWNVVDSDITYDLPGTVEQLLRTAVRLTCLKIEYENVTHLTSHQQFSENMLRTLCQHRTLTTILLDFPHGLDW